MADPSRAGRRAGRLLRRGARGRRGIPRSRSGSGSRMDGRSE
ncbi:hypothetical protein L665_04965 [Ralstonia solanacearum SD54]|nr:hypothetical protein L665_04965 [Ralstonia solanacearum SD54]